MTYERLAYADQDPASTMTTDCAACGERFHVPQAGLDVFLGRPAPPLDFDSYPREVRKPQVSVSAAAAHLASRLHLHLD